LFLLCVITFMQAYLITWIVPEYKIIEESVISKAPDSSSGIIYLLLLFAAVMTIAVTVVLLNRRKSEID